MKIKAWLKAATKDERAELIKKCGISMAYLWQLSGGHKIPSCKLAVKLETYSRLITPDRVISMELLRPDLADLLIQARNS